MRTKGKARKARLSSLSVLLAMLAIVTTPGTAAHATTSPGVTATPYNMTHHWWSSDGCTVVPDSGTTFDFHHACIHHDGCYAHRWASKATCDWWFYNDMRASCAAMFRWYSWQSPFCNDRAYKYYLGVTYFGWPYYYNRTAYIPMNQYIA